MAGVDTSTMGYVDVCNKVSEYSLQCVLVIVWYECVVFQIVA